MKLHGKELDAELAKRKQEQEDRRSQRISIREAAKIKNLRPSEYLDWEQGHNICPHEKYEDMLGGVPIPKLIFKKCKKCGKIDEKSMEKVTDKNLKKTYKIMQKIMSNGKEDFCKK